MSGEFDKAMRQGLSGARSILAPLYLGVGLMLVVVLIQFVRDFFRALPVAFSSDAFAVVQIALSLATILVVAGVVLTVLQTGQALFSGPGDAAGSPPGGPVQFDFARLRKRLMEAAIMLVLLLSIDQLIAMRATGSVATAGAPWPLFQALGVLVVARLVMAVTDWFARLAGGRAED